MLVLLVAVYSGSVGSVVGVVVVGGGVVVDVN